MGRLSGKAVLVTGAASGIGKATAMALSKEAARVAVADIDRAGVEAVAKALQAEGAEALPIRCDVSQAAQVEAMVAEVVARFGRIDGAVNNAGIEGPSARTAEYDEAAFDQVINVNLKGVWLCMRHEIPKMVAQGGGAIVNTSSVAGQVGFYGAPAYSASKHGVLGLTRTAALEYAKHGVRVNAVCPGVVRTPMVDRFTGGDEAYLKEIAHAYPVRRLGRPEEVDSAIVWLLSDEASFTTGSAVTVDGGLLAM